MVIKEITITVDLKGKLIDYDLRGEVVIEVFFTHVVKENVVIYKEMILPVHYEINDNVVQKIKINEDFINKIAINTVAN